MKKLLYEVMKELTKLSSPVIFLVFNYLMDCSFLYLCCHLFYFLVQVQQVMDSLVITLAQQSETNLTSEVSHLYQERFIPKHVRLAPFPTRQYTDDEFQTIVKQVMGVL